MKKYVSFILSVSLAAFAADGTLDTATFNAPNGTFVTTNQFGAGESSANAVVVRYDGRIVVGGGAAVGSGTNFALLILNADGTVNATNSSIHVGAVGSNDSISGLAVQPDLKVVAVGTSVDATSYPSQFVIARYCANGQPDLTFGTAGVVVVDFLPVVTGPGPISAEALAVALMRDGRIVVVGRSQVIGNDLNSPYFYAVAVLNQDGTLDNSFASGAGRRVYATTAIPGNISSVANAVAIQSIGGTDNIILAGRGEVAANAQRFQIVRILPSGDLDLTFGVNGVDQVVFNAGINEEAKGVDVYPNGTIVAVGFSLNTNSEAVLTRRLATGGADNTFDGDGLVIFAQPGVDIAANAVNVQNNGSVLIAGSYNNPPTFITGRFTSAGALDTATFNPPTGYALQDFNEAVASALALQSNGEIVVAGNAEDGTQMGVLRYLNNNTTDQVFVEPTFTAPADTFANCTDNPPTLTGAAQNPSNITVYVNGVESGRTVTTGSSNTWSFTLPAPLAVGANTFQIVAEYKSGNMNALSPFACCGVGLGPQSCISEAIRSKYCASCIDTPINTACPV